MPGSRHLALALCALAAGLAPAASAAEPSPAQRNRGQAVFMARCAACHGVNADGASALAAVMAVKPANLRKSVLTDADRRLIVMQGGGALGRSANMPGWQTELDAEDLAAVIAFASSIATPPAKPAGSVN